MRTQLFWSGTAGLVVRSGIGLWAMRMITSPSIPQRCRALRAMRGLEAQCAAVLSRQSKRAAFLCICAAALLALAGCSTSQPPSETWRTTTDRPFNAVAQLLAIQATKCWARTGTWGRDPVLVDVNRSQGMVEIAARRRPIDIRIDPFVYIFVTRVGNSTLVRVEEGEYTTRILGVTNHVRNWMAGRLKCEDVDY